jgi:thioredoxin-dependent peroxiredoxin
MKKLILSFLVLWNFLFASSGELKVGELAPDFSLSDQDGNVQTLSAYRGQKVVVYFYPKDDTPGCTKEACSIRDDFTMFQDARIIVFGISYDDAESHREFQAKYHLPFILLSDTDKSVSKSYESQGMFFASRKTFLIDENGILVKIYENVDVSTHGKDIIAAFAELDLKK